jgi:hypothetical protein
MITFMSRPFYTPIKSPVPVGNEVMWDPKAAWEFFEGTQSRGPYRELNCEPSKRWTSRYANYVTPYTSMYFVFLFV